MSEIAEVEAQAPPLPEGLQPPEVEMGYALAGAMVGSGLGFGAGHAIQGRYSSDGWKWTALEAGALATLMIGASTCSDSPRALTCETLPLASDDARDSPPLLVPVATSSGHLGLGVAFGW